jgi:hypothetical protein
MTSIFVPTLINLTAPIVAAAAIALPSQTTAQIPVPPAASQNPSPMVERTRAHERLTPLKLDGTTRSFAGPAGKAVDLWIPDRARARDTVDLVVHFHGAVWLPQQAVSGLGDTVVAVVAPDLARMTTLLLRRHLTHC